MMTKRCDRVNAENRRMVSMKRSGIIGLLLLVMCSPVLANVVLTGQMKIGDNDYSVIEPRFLIQKNYWDQWQPENPINFHLSEKIQLNQIRLESASGISAPLYFVIWDNRNNVVYDKESSYMDLSQSITGNTELAAGDYQLAVVGQCFDGSSVRGWDNECDSLIWGNDYDDFAFTDITLISPDTSKSKAFIQRRHIGDSTEPDYPESGRGYPGRWYPDRHEATKISYPFRVTASEKLEKLTMYGYRDLEVRKNNIELKITDLSRNKVIARKFLRSNVNEEGNFSWDLSGVKTTLVPGNNYQLSIGYKKNRRDLDDISWDDIVLKFDPTQSTDINHYQILHDGLALTCEPEKIIIKACTNAFNGSGDCQETSRQTSAQLVAKIKNSNTVVGRMDTTFVGSSNLDLAYKQPKTLQLSLAEIGTRPYYCNTGGAGSCDILFEDAGFKFNYGNGDDINNQVAGKVFPQSVKLSAFYNDKGQCKALFDNNIKLPIGLGVQCLSPGNCSTQNFTVGGTALEKNPADSLNHFEAIPLTFKKNVATLPASLFEDAGQIKLAAQYKIGNELPELKDLILQGQSNAFWVRPDRLRVLAIGNKEPADKVILNNETATGTPVYSAAKVFSFEVSGINAQGNTTLNYTPVKPENIQVQLTRLGPAEGGVDGTLYYAPDRSLTAPLKTPKWRTFTGLTPFTNGVSAYGQAYYNEVGIVKINVRDTDYHGHEITIEGDEAAPIGRFVPDHFELSANSVENYVEGGLAYDHVFPSGLKSYQAGSRVLAPDQNVYQCREWPNNGFCSQWNTGSNQYEPGVGSSWASAWTLLGKGGEGTRFTYMDQPELKFSYKISALNTLGDVTQNYIDDYNKADVSFIGEHVINNKSTVDVTDRLQDFAGTWCGGIYQSGSCKTFGADSGKFTRLTTGPDGPFSRALFGVKIKDADGVVLKDLDMPTVSPIGKRLSDKTSALRYGLWRINDKYGPISDPMAVTMQLEYYDGSTFILNTDDSETDFSATKTTLKDDGLGEPLPEVTGQGTFAKGITEALIIAAPDRAGEVILNYEAPVWFRYNWENSGTKGFTDNPRANIQFGFYYGNDHVIYRRRLN